MSCSTTHIGLSVGGWQARYHGFEANRMDYEAVYVESGSLTLSDGLASEVAVGLANHGTAYVEAFTVKEAGVAVQALDGALTLDGLSVENASVGIYGFWSLIHGGRVQRS